MLKTVRFELYQRVEISIHGNLNGHPNLITTFYLSNDGLPVGEVEQKFVQGTEGVRQHLLKCTHTFFYSTYPYKRCYPTGCLRITKPYIDETHAVYHKIESFNTQVAPKYLYVIMTNDENATQMTLQDWAFKSYTKFTQPLSSNEYEEKFESIMHLFDSEIWKNEKFDYLTAHLSHYLIYKRIMGKFDDKTLLRKMDANFNYHKYYM